MRALGVTRPLVASGRIAGCGSITADDGSFSSGNLAPGATFQTTLSAQGSYPYHCAIHPTMRGTVSVGP